MTGDEKQPENLYTCPKCHTNFAALYQYWKRMREVHNERAVEKR